MATIASAIIILFVGAYIQVYCAFHPNGGEIFRAGEQIELRWEAEVFADEPVRVIIHDGRRGQSIVVTDQYPGRVGKVTWRIPAGFSGDLYRLVVIGERSNTRRQGVGYFRITNEIAPPDVTIGTELLRIVPNPAREHIVCTWQQTDAAEILLHTLSGDIIERSSVVGTRQYYKDIRGLTNGVYGIMVRLLNGEQLFAKFIIKKE